MASEMELVNLFNSELSSLYDVKPPISKGKMTAITKAALKAVKLYKHVVQSVEKFIQKCKAEYKIPGLYVIDSIIRQSRHQYGVEKDIFTSRFSRNLQATFVHIYRCPEEDKPKVIRVLNLWQKNKIFNPEAIAPLFDLADPNNAIWETVSTIVESGASGSGGGTSAGNGQTNSNNTANSFYNEIQFKSHLLDYDYDEDPDDVEKSAGNSATPSTNLQAPPPPIIRTEPTSAQLAANSLAGMDALGSILSNPEVLRQLQTLQEQMTAAAQAQHHQNEYLTPEQERQRKLAELNKQEAAFDQRLAQTVAKTHFAVECGDFIEDQENKAKSPEVNFQAGSTDQNSNQLSQGVLAPPPFFQQISGDQGRVAGNPFGLPLNFPLIASQFAVQQQQSEQNAMAMYATQLHGDPGMFQNFQPQQPLTFDPMIQGGVDMEDDDIIEIRNHRGDRNERDRNRNDRRRRRSRSRGSRSNDLSPSRTGRSRRSRSSSRNHSSSRSGKRRDRSRERREEKERQRKGFGAIRREHLSVCSTTLWVGHLSKLVSQEELSDTFGPYGDVVSIDLIQSRGCAFVVMNRRQDAVRALDRLKKGTKLQGKEITLAWAPGKGVKGRDWKDYWEVDCGISYIPWSKLTIETDLEEFEDGGCADESTLPDFLKNLPKKEKVDSSEERKESISITSDAPNEISPLTSKAATGSNGIAVNDVDGRTEIVTGQLTIPTPVPPAILPNNAFGMPPSVGMLGVPPMALNMMMPPPIIGGPMGLPQFQLMGMMGPLGLNPDSPASQMKMPSAGSGLLGDGPLVQMENTNTLQMNSANTMPDEDERDDERKRTNPERERKRSRFNNPDEKYSPTRDIEARNEPPIQEQRSEEQLFDRLKSMAGGYSGNKSTGNSDGMSMANSLLGQPIIGGPGPPPLLGPRGPNNFRGGGGFRPPFMNDRSGIRPWFDGGPPSQNPFMNPSQNPFVAAGGNPFISNNENPFDDRRGPKEHGDRPEFFGGPNERFNSKRGGWREGPPGPWRGRGGPPMRGGRGGRWRQPKPNHNFIVNNNS